MGIKIVSFDKDGKGRKIYDVEEEECKDATKTLKNLGVTQDEFDTFVHADMEDVPRKLSEDEVLEEVKLRRGGIEPLICECGERLDEDSWCGECMRKIRRELECSRRSLECARQSVEYWQGKALEVARSMGAEEDCRDATKTLKDLGVTQDEFATNAHADMEEIDAMQADIDAQRVKPLICECGELLDENSWCAECMHKTRRAVDKYMHRMHEAEAEIERLREENKRLRTALPMYWADTALIQERGE